MKVLLGLLVIGCCIVILGNLDIEFATVTEIAMREALYGLETPLIKYIHWDGWSPISIIAGTVLGFLIIILGMIKIFVRLQRYNQP